MLKKKTAYFCISLICILLCGCSGKSDDVIFIGSEDMFISEDEIDEDSGGQNENILVYVCGAVGLPGVVEIPEGSRVEDALEAAGGFGEGAHRYSVNLADWVTDGQMIYVPTAEEAESGQAWTLGVSVQAVGTQSSVATTDNPVNINTADAALLCTLPGIGQSRAADIIAYRQENGPFQSCEDIMSVPGIKTGVYEKICDRITVDERHMP